MSVGCFARPPECECKFISRTVRSEEVMIVIIREEMNLWGKTRRVTEDGWGASESQMKVIRIQSKFMAR